MPYSDAHTTLAALIDKGYRQPTGNLDKETRREIMEILRDLAGKGKCVILVSHSSDVANMCDERYELVKISGKKK